MRALSLQPAQTAWFNAQIFQANTQGPHNKSTAGTHARFVPLIMHAISMHTTSTAISVSYTTQLLKFRNFTSKPAFPIKWLLRETACIYKLIVTRWGLFYLKVFPWLNFFPPNSPSQAQYSSTVFLVSAESGSSLVHEYDS